MKRLLICKDCFSNFLPIDSSKVKNGFNKSKLKCSHCGKNIKKNEILTCITFGGDDNWVKDFISENRVEDHYGHSTIHGPSKRELRLEKIKERNKYYGIKYNPHRSRFYY